MRTIALSRFEGDQEASRRPAGNCGHLPPSRPATSCLNATRSPTKRGCTRGIASEPPTTVACTIAQGVKPPSAASVVLATAPSPPDVRGGCTCTRWVLMAGTAEIGGGGGPAAGAQSGCCHDVVAARVKDGERALVAGTDGDEAICQSFFACCCGSVLASAPPWIGSDGERRSPADVATAAGQARGPRCTNVGVGAVESRCTCGSGGCRGGCFDFT